MRRIFANIWLQLFLGLIVGILGVIIAFSLTIILSIKYSGLGLGGGDGSPITFIFAAVFYILIFTFPTMVWIVLNRFGRLKSKSLGVELGILILFVTLPFWMYLGWQTSSRIQTASEKYHAVRDPCIIKNGINRKPLGDTTSEFECKDGVLNGFTRTYNAQGILIFEGVKLQGKWNGIATSYYDDGKVNFVTTYKEGEKEGVEVFFNPNGSTDLYIINHQGSTQWVYYSIPEKYYNVSNALDLESQRIICQDQETNFVKQYSFHCQNNLVHGEFIAYDANGNVFFKVKMTNGFPDGIYEKFIEGQLQSHLEFENGKLVGKVQQFFSDGTLQYEGQYVNGLQEGIFRRYDSEGNLESEVVFKNGKLIEISTSPPMPRP